MLKTVSFDKKYSHFQSFCMIFLEMNSHLLANVLYPGMRGQRSNGARRRSAVVSHFCGGSNVSHIVQIQTEIRDASAIRAACNRLRLPEPVFGEVKLFSSSAVGWQIRLPDWRYPVVADVNTGRLRYDETASPVSKPKERPKMRQEP